MRDQVRQWWVSDWQDQPKSGLLSYTYHVTIHFCLLNLTSVPKDGLGESVGPCLLSEMSNMFASLALL